MSTSDTPNSLTTSGLAKCPTLRGKDNYTEWEEIMRSNLRTSGCWDIISGEELALSKPDPFYTSRNRPSGVKTLRQAEAEYAQLDDAGDFIHNKESCKERVKKIKNQVSGYKNHTKLKEKAKNLIINSIIKDL
jgi:ribosomal protein S17E